jgi:hypothetical protein
MISHGVDLERINLMLMDKFPAEIAEYIQASSRSGRKRVGLVGIVLPAHNLRASSVYHRFKEYHQHIDRMVSPVPVNRFAKYAALRTLSGITSGLFFGLLGPKQNDLGFTKRHKALAWLNENREEAENFIRSAYALGDGVYDKDLEDYYWQIIQEKFGELVQLLKSSGEDRTTEAMRPPPMTSLRDVESGVPFRPKTTDFTYLQWFRKSSE